MHNLCARTRKVFMSSNCSESVGMCTLFRTCALRAEWILHDVHPKDGCSDSPQFGSVFRDHAETKRFLIETSVWVISLAL